MTACPTVATMSPILNRSDSMAKRAPPKWSRQDAEQAIRTLRDAFVACVDAVASMSRAHPQASESLLRHAAIRSRDADEKLFSERRLRLAFATLIVVGALGIAALLVVRDKPELALTVVTAVVTSAFAYLRLGMRPLQDESRARRTDDSKEKPSAHGR